MSLKTPRLVVLSLLVLLAIQLLTSCAKEPEGEADGVRWLASLEDALELAKKNHQPIMIDFYADWCGWCKRLDSDTYVHEDVVSRAKDFVSLRIDADVERDLSSRYRVAGLPTILFIDHTGREIHRVVGYRSASSFATEMDRALEVFRRKAGAGRGSNRGG